MVSSLLRGAFSSCARRLSALLLVILIGPSLALGQSTSTTVYVDRNGPENGDGTSFKKALLTIQAGIDKAASGAQVRVANGTYHERVTLKTGVSVWGGYSGSTSDTVRNPTRYKAIISSDGVAGVSSGTVIMSGVTNTRLDGFTVTGARTFSAGGGVYCASANNTNQILNCFITGNQPQYGTGAGIYCRGASPMIADCVIAGNTGGAAGGGIVLDASSSPTIMECTIRFNTTYGIACGTGCSPQIVNTILANQSGTAVAALAANANPLLIHDLFFKNALNYRGSDGTPLNSVNLINMTVTGSYGNVAGDPLLDTGDILAFKLHAGSAALDRGLLTATQAIDIEGNARPGTDKLLDIGADEATSNWTPTQDHTAPVSTIAPLPVVVIGPVINITTAASDDGSGFAKLYLFYRRNGGSWKKYGTSYTTSPIPFGQVSIDGDGFYEFYTQAVDVAGNVEPAPAQPKASTTLFLFAPGPRFYVNAAATGKNTGKTWADAFTSLNRALSAGAATGGVKEIWVARGTYTPAGPGGDRTASFRLISGAVMYGGFAGTETSLSQRNPAVNVTILSGDLNGNDAQAAKTTATSDNSYHVVDASGVAAGTLLDGFTVSGGVAAGSGEAANGGGLYINAGRPTLRNLKITGNQTGDGPDTVTLSNAGAGVGAGIYCTTGSQVKLILCTISGNRTGHGGRSNTVSASNPVFNYGNGGNGGGIFSRGSALTLTTCTVAGNVTGYGGTVLGAITAGHGGHGAGIYGEAGSSFAVSDSTISGNVTGTGVNADQGDTYAGGNGGNGAGFYATGSAASFINTQITNNVTGAGACGLFGGAGGSGAGIYFAQGTSPLTLTRSAVSKNTTGLGGGSRGLTGPGGDGGGIVVARSKAALTGCQVNANRTGNSGSDLSQAMGSSGGQGGGIFATSSTLNLTQCNVNQNQTGAGASSFASLSGPGGNGGGIRCLTTTATLVNCVLAGNGTGVGGGFGSASGGTGANAGLQAASNVEAGSGGNGGAIASTGLAGLNVWYCTVAYNTAGRGGYGLTAARNGANGLAGGIYYTTTSIVAAKNAAYATTGTQTVKKGPSAQIADVILWGNQEVSSVGEAAQIRGNVNVKYCDIQGLTGSLGGVGNIGQDPQFRRSELLNLHLRAGSPAIDKGSRLNGVTTVDLDGAGRPFDGDGKGAVTGDRSDYDMGAYEYHGVNVGPTVTSINATGSNPTAASQAGYQVFFSEPVTGVDAGDFTLNVTGCTGAAIASVSGKGSVYTVTVSTGSGDGTLRLDLKDSGTGIVNVSGQPLREGAMGPVYTVNK